MIRTALCDLLDIQYPIIQGGMAWISTAELVAAVSEAGGLGVIGAGTVGGGVIEILSANTDVIQDKTGAEISLRHVAELKRELLKDVTLELSLIHISEPTRPY